MAGSGMGMNVVHLTGCRVAAIPTYIPAYVKNGQTIDQQLKVRVAINMKTRKNSPKKVVYVDLCIWGKLADKCALSFNIGKEFNIMGELDDYKGRVFVDKKPVVGADGQPIRTSKMSVKVNDLTFGEEADTTVEKEIANNERPATWNIMGTEGYAFWQKFLSEQAGLTYTKGDKFGYANVSKSTVSESAPLQEQVKAAVNADQRPY